MKRRTLSHALAALEREAIARTEQANVELLSLKEINTAVEVFQPRNVEANLQRSDAHIKGLTEAIQGKPTSVLDAIIVWWSGKAWYVIDGHHRLEAYKRAAGKGKAKPKDIPVEVFRGSLQEAIRQASRLNCRNKLEMTKADKLERAWMLTCMEEGSSKAEISEATGVSDRTVATMRRKKADLLKVNPQRNLLGLTWEEAKRGEQRTLDEDWLERQAREWSSRLVKTFGNKLIDQPEIAARAIQMYSDRLPLELVRFFPEARQEADQEENDLRAVEEGLAGEEDREF